MTDDANNPNKGLGEELYTLVKSSLVVFFAKTAGRVGALLGQILIVRSLTPATFGDIALAYTLVMLIGRLIANGFRDGVTHYISMGTGERDSLERFQSGLLFAVTLSGASFVGLYLFRPVLSSLLQNAALIDWMSMFLPYLIVFPLAQLCIADFRGRKQTAVPVVTEHLLGTAAAIIAFGCLAVIGDAESGAIAYWYMPSVVVLIVLSVPILRRYPIRRLLGVVPNRRSVQELWRYSWPLLVGSSFALFLDNVDILMISYFMDSAAVGRYRAIQPLRQVTVFLIASTTFLYFPIASELNSNGNHETLAALYKTTTKWVVAGTVPIILIFALFAGDVVVGFFGDDYRSAAPALAVLVCGMFSRTVVGPSGVMVKAVNRSRSEMFAAAVGLGVNLIVNVLLIPRFGLVGAALGTSIGVAVFNLVEVVTIYRVTESTPFSVSELKQLLPTITVSVVIAFALREYELGLVALVSLGMVISVVQLVSTVFTRSLGDADLQLVDAIEAQSDRDLTTVRQYVRRFS